MSSKKRALNEDYNSQIKLIRMLLLGPEIYGKCLTSAVSQTELAARLQSLKSQKKCALSSTVDDLAYLCKLKSNNKFVEPSEHQRPFKDYYNKTSRDCLRQSQKPLTTFENYACPVCMKDFKDYSLTFIDPHDITDLSRERVFPSGHLVCKNCLSSMLSMSMTKCPVCRAPFAADINQRITAGRLFEEDEEDEPVDADLEVQSVTLKPQRQYTAKEINEFLQSKKRS
jgi:uncharacterized CHY-type Zn-finger protein